ncbi:glycerol-3-phosphate dehydrogenase/oxidase [Cytobacillus depressus]|uniref:Glycerol-3-phosphate dehydrogenase n=1 Tax=Cytobacillus depressus TaxID=1602942 RepID=A0A6L3V939_9BACI|nr:FAD-dependent oxidoreductase [Cytobacillus depressus]KAB2338130.1 glycerol-3-phosphate dehydrogenase/oxidase [Cytobacillus depressus]
MTFSNKDRQDIINKLTGENFDVLIIGGGITGAGIALDASARGMKTALVEMQDFAAGTSSRSTKLVHGGLRYLKNMEVKLVAEVGKERAIVYENGPHVTTPEWMLLPIYLDGTFGRFSTSIGLKIYDFLAGVKKPERRILLNAKDTLNKVPFLRKQGLKGSGYYVEYRTDDARLTIEVMKAAHEKGATLINYMKAEQLLYENNKVGGVLVVDEMTSETYQIKAKKIVNAAGPWIDSIREMDQSKQGKSLQLTKGVHIVIDQEKFPLKQAVYFDTQDKRMIFAIPRNGKTYIGTTDTFFSGDARKPKITNDDRNYLIQAINYMFPELEITEKDIESSWAGIRPLILEEGKGPSEISRKDEIWESDSGLITIAGGKLTGYRKMAEMIVNLLARKLKEEKNLDFDTCKTKTLPISGGNVGGASHFQAYIQSESENRTKLGLLKNEAMHLLSMYGSNASILFTMIEKDGGKEAVQYEMPLILWVKLKYALEFEMAASPADFFIRRTSDLLFDHRTVLKYKDQVITYMADYFSWTEEIKNNLLKELEQDINDTTKFPII